MCILRGDDMYFSGRLTGIFRTVCILLLTFVVFGLLFSAGDAESASVGSRKKIIAVIISTRWHSLDALDVRDLKLIFLGKKGSIGNVVVKPINRRRGMRVRKAFDRLVMGMTERHLREYWIAEQLKGGARPPLEFGLVSALVNAVSEKVGAISYVDLDELQPGDRERVKIIKIIKGGKEFGVGDDRYPLVY